MKTIVLLTPSLHNQAQSRALDRSMNFSDCLVINNFKRHNTNKKEAEKKKRSHANGWTCHDQKNFARSKYAFLLSPFLFFFLSIYLSFFSLLSGLLWISSFVRCFISGLLNNCLAYCVWWNHDRNGVNHELIHTAPYLMRKACECWTWEMGEQSSEWKKKTTTTTREKKSE